MAKFTIKLMQFVEEVCEITVDADNIAAAQAIVEHSINQNMLDEEYDLDWSDGTGIHFDGVIVDEVKRAD